MGLLSWIALISLFFYLTPFLRLLGRPLRAVLAPKKKSIPVSFNSFLIKIGRWEYLLGPFRDRLLSVLLLSIVVWRWLKESPLSQETLLASSLIVFYNLLAIITIRYRDGVRLKLAEIARVHSNTHPEDFFNLYYLSLSPWPPTFPVEGLREIDFQNADYRSGKPPIHSRWPIVESALATSTLARMAIMAFKRVGPEYGRDAFDGLARLWGSRVAQIFRCHLKIDGARDIPPIEGKSLLLFNHKSYLDFALNFFALGSIHKSDGRHLRPRFIAAKDHFIDNPFIYSWIGLGKVIENAGMIFINREKGKGWAAMQQAADILVSRDVEIAVYPQGTRAYFMRSPTGERLDAGYYTTFTKKTWDEPLGHLKPGTANLILDTLIALRQRGERKLNILVTGIVGSAVAGPKGSFKAQTEAEVRFKILPVWELPTELAAGLKSPGGNEASTPEEKRYLEQLTRMQVEINAKLLAATDWHQYLLNRLPVELKHLEFPEAEIEAVSKRLVQAEAEGEVRPFILLDRIFSLEPSLWDRFLRLFVPLLQRNFGDPSWKALLQEVSERLRTR
ncbi:MAG TPA: lysophospholipid acyltransferase family protein [bacterium]|nr:lysophospholipid acyltransferase family protein [bacterium]